MEKTIGAAAEALGLSQDTLRYYEKIGLIPRAAKSRGGHRLYSEHDLARLRFVQRAQGVGFSLVEIKKLLRLRANPEGCTQAIRDMALQKCNELERQRVELEAMKRELGALLEQC